MNGHLHNALLLFELKVVVVKTVRDMDAAIELTWMYLQRVLTITVGSIN